MDASIAANMYNCRENSITVLAAQQDIYVSKTLDKVWKALSFMNDYTDGGFFKLSQVSNTQYLKKASHYKVVNGQKIEAGWMSQIQGIVADKPNKIRGDRTDLLIYEEGGCHAPGTEVVMYDGSLRKVEDVKLGDILMGDDGTPRTVIELHSGKDQMYKIVPKVGDEQIVNSKHIIYGKHRNYSKDTYEDFTMSAEDFYNMVIENPRKKDGYKLIHSDRISFPHQEVPIDPYLFGFWLGDGNSDKARFTSEDPEIIDYLVNYGNIHNYKISITDCENSKKCKHIYFGIQEGTVNEFHAKLRDLNVLNNKHIPDIYLYNDKETLLQLLAGLMDSDGTYCKDKQVFQFTQCESRKHIVDQVEYICHLLGMKVSRDVKISKERILNGKTIKGGVKQYRITILYGHSQIPCKLPRKQSTDRTNSKHKSQKDRLDSTFKIEKLGIGKYYGFSLTGNQLFLLKDFTVCHNSWPNLTKAFIQGDALVGIQGSKFGIKVVGGTGGDSGAALEGLRDIYYNPDVYDVLPFRHNFSHTGEEALTGYFIPAFTMVNTPECMDSRGYTNPEKGKEYYDRERARKAKDPKALITYSAEYCYNAEEAFSLEGDNKFNKVNIAEQLAQIRVLKKGPQVETGFLEYKFKNGEHVEQNIDGFRWIPSQNGKIKILEHPLWVLPDVVDEETGKTVKSYPKEKLKDLYVIGIDGIDIGASQTSEYTKDPSDFCLVVKKRVYGIGEPQYVAVYKDRPQQITEAYKIAIKLAQYYNATINIEATRMSLTTWARDHKYLKYFMKRPRATLNDIQRGTSKQYGTPATAAIIAHQTDLIADFVNDYCHTIWFEEILDELNRYTDENKRKFDLVAAMGMAELADEELSGVVPKAVEIKKDTWADFGYYTDSTGARRYGRIPTAPKEIVRNNNFGQLYDGNILRTSDPRLYSGYL